jgi:phosphate-selective porin OprO and OprP
MEPAAPLQAIAPPNMVGFQVGQPVFSERATWALGVFGDATPSAEYGNASKNYSSTIGRLTWLVLDQLDPDHPAANRLLHLGVSADYQYSATSNVRYQSRPECYLAPIVIDTGNIDASGAATVGGEVAWVNGPFSAQGELIHSFVQENNGSLLNFGGFYAQASWFLTGESRPYDPIAGDFKRLIPRRDFNFGKAGAWGAVELACRFSHTDLDDAQIRGGRLNLLVAGVNWYLSPHVRWMFNYGMGRVSGGLWDGHMFIFQTRLGVDF